MKNIVIGSGPAGRLGSLELGKLGEEVTLIEKNHIAGTCLNEGCMVKCALTDITKFIENNNKFNSYGFIKSQLDISYEKIVEKILKEFGLENEDAHIINGHVPVKTIKGEQPMKAGGKLLVIDGGFSKAYQPETGIAGYTLVYSSYGLSLTDHEPFTSAEDAVETERDIVSNRVAVRYNPRRALVGDTDNGKALKERIQELKQLLDAYRKGVIKEKK